MRRFVSMFMALVVAFTMGPNMVVRAQENACEGEICRINDESLTGWAWCKENLKDCAAYAGETALNGTKLVAVKAWDVTKPVCDKVWDETAWVRGKMADGAVTTWNALKNYNYTQLGENVKWCAHNPGDCAASVYDDAKGWIGDRVDDVAEFNGALQNFYDYDLNGQSKWPFWSMVAVATWPIVKPVGKVVMLPVRFAMKLFSPCFRANSSN